MRKTTGVLFAMAVLCAIFAAAAGQPSVPLAKAVDLFRNERWADAATLFEVVEKAAPGKTDALLYRGKALTRLELFNEAADSLESFVKVHPKSADGLYSYSYVLFRQGRPEASIKNFGAAAEVRSPTASELTFLALDYAQLDDVDDASYHLEKALSLAPNDFEAKYQLGRIRYRQRRPDQAVLIFTELLKRDPTNLRVQLNLGLSFDTRGQYDLAAEAYRKAIELDSSSKHRTEFPYLYLGRLLVRTNRIDDAMAIMLQGLAINPRCSRLHADLGRVYLTKSRTDEARDEFESAIRLDPRNRAAHYLLARLYSSSGKREKADEHFQIAKELSQAEMSAGSQKSGMGGPMEMPPE